MSPPVFLGSAGLVVAFVAFGAGFTDTARRVFPALQRFTVEHFGWLYVVSATLILVFVVWLGFSRFGSIRLGGDEAEPDFGHLAWFAMLFSAGMGTGLVFWGVAEPLSHLQSPPRGSPGDADAVERALALSFFHWGLHPWAIYALFALSIAYFHFRHGLPLAPRSMLFPLLGERIRGWPGHAVDVVCTVGTLFGVATSLGLGARQIEVGLARLVDVEGGTGLQVAIIACVTAVATTSVVLGIDRGVRRLSQLNLALAAGVLGFVLVAGPTLYAIEAGVTATGRYLDELPRMALWIQLGADASWQRDWTLFYWSWWISWSPFVGVFVARISRGRTVREFVWAVLGIPTGVTFVWLSVMGGTALRHASETGSDLASEVLETPAVALHALLDELPFAGVTGFAATLLVVVFFITSSDSGSLVDDMVTSGGHPNPPVAQRVFWAVAEGAVAATLLTAGGLTALRTAALQSGLPMAVLLLGAAAGLVRALRADARSEGAPSRAALKSDTDH